jgi:hypothetical protein
MIDVPATPPQQTSPATIQAPSASGRYQGNWPITSAALGSGIHSPHRIGTQQGPPRQGWRWICLSVSRSVFLSLCKRGTMRARDATFCAFLAHGARRLSTGRGGRARGGGSVWGIPAGLFSQGRVLVTVQVCICLRSQPRWRRVAAEDIIASFGYRVSCLFPFLGWYFLV